MAGLMSRIFGGGKGSSDGSELIGLANSGQKDGFSHLNHGWEGVYRSVPVLTNPRGFSPHETGALQAKAQQAKVQAENAKAAMKALESIEDSDRDIHVSYRGYQGVVADRLQQKLGANTEYAKKLNVIREQDRQRQLLLQQQVERTNGVLQGINSWQQQTSGFFN